MAALSPSSTTTPSDAPHEVLAAQNKLLFDRLRLPPIVHAGKRVQAPREACQRLHTACRAAFAAAEARGEHGGLFLSAGGASKCFWGFQNYDRVQASLNPQVQRQFTTMLPLHEVEDARWRPLLFGGLDGLEELVGYAKGLAEGHTLLACHMLRQDSEQACFGWHQDNLNNPHTHISMVFMLSSSKSSMQVAGSDPFIYDGVGSGVIFPSAAHHRSGPASRGTLKITFFFGVSQSSAAMFLSRKMRGEW
ncbi:hypothetical protein AB1Y20_022435 [Prymnesium parvum]|uniref:Fe2OG dioxygenase domain-containing protein n=1 Tax=Prymnesium parvum TaxID=97485 RepID=A0AB34JG60_PRYPA